MLMHSTNNIIIGAFKELIINENRSDVVSISKVMLMASKSLSIQY